jgi:beta-glucanase (GH16 family)
MKKILRPISILLMALPAFTFAQNRENGYHLVWSEEFNGDSVDTSVWNFEKGFLRNHEWQYYQKDNARVADGMLTITARLEHGRGDIECTSASINTAGKKAFLYGRFEVRARIPYARGAWPAIWMLGNQWPWPSCGEIDMMEFYHKNGIPGILANVACGTDRPNVASWNSKFTPYDHFLQKDKYWSDKFHVWRMDWDETAIRLYLDDELLNEVFLKDTRNGSIGNYKNPFNTPQYILLNLAIGGNNGGSVDMDALPLKYDVDYVRVYQKNK